AHRAGDVVGEADDARRLDSRRRFEFVERHYRTRPRIDDFATHAEIGQYAFERDSVLLQDFTRHGGAANPARRIEEFERRKHIAAAGTPRPRARLAYPRRLVFLVIGLFVALGVRDRAKARFDSS